MELCQGGELFEKITSVKHFTEREAAHIFQQMANAVGYCFTKKICHKDLKPENFMFTTQDADASVKLIDFGLSQFFQDKSNIFY